MAYQKITDIFMTTSIDYDKNSEEAYTFFKIVQNKLHYAITGRTAAELIYERVDAEKINMGLTTWKEAHNEYEKYRVKQDQQYISSMDEMYKRYLEENNNV